MTSIISLLGWAIVVIATTFLAIAVMMEYQAHEPKWALLMKISSVGFGIGGILVGLGSM